MSGSAEDWTPEDAGTEQGGYAFDDDGNAYGSTYEDDKEWEDYQNGTLDCGD